MNDGNKMVIHNSAVLFEILFPRDRIHHMDLIRSRVVVAVVRRRLVVAARIAVVEKTLCFEVANRDAIVPAIRMGTVSISIGTPDLPSCKKESEDHDAKRLFPHEPPPNSRNSMAHARQRTTTI